MNILQLFSHIETSLLPEQGGKFSIKEDTDKTTVSIFTYKKEDRVFGPIFIFEKAKTKEKNKFEYSCFVQSDMSGIKYKLGFVLEDRLFDDILAGLHAIDQHYMKDLEAMIDLIVLPKKEEEVSINEDLVNE